VKKIGINSMGVEKKEKKRKDINKMAKRKKE
jgi:hypothetical protein